MRSSLHPSSRSSLRHQPIHTKPCVEPLERRTLLAAPAGVQQTDGLSASATFVAERSAAEWGLQSHSGDPAEPIVVTAQVLGGADEFLEVNGPNHFVSSGAAVTLVATSSVTGDVYFDIIGGTVPGDVVAFSMSASAHSATLDAVIPAVDLTTNTALNVSVHMEWTAISAAPQGGADVFLGDESQVHTEVTREIFHDATASGTVTVDAYGAVNFTPGTSQSAALQKFSFDTINRYRPSITSELFSQMPVLS